MKHWFVTYDPRKPSMKLMPFVPFGRQEDCIEWMHARYIAHENGEVEKSRDVGVTWLIDYFATWLWLFGSGAKVGIGSRKGVLVDQIGNPDSIFEKIRINLRYMPRELLPDGFDVNRDAAYMRIVNPMTGAAITGEVGDQIGRGGRSSVYFLDEAAFIERPELVDASLSQNSDCIIEVSTVNPGAAGGPFHRKRNRHVGTQHLFEFDWRDDPRKNDAWYADQKTRNDPAVVASELDRNWEADADNVVCPAAWVRAAKELSLKASGKRIGGGDVGGGSDLSVLIVRQGPRVEMPIAWTDPDIIDTARVFVDLCKQHRVDMLNYDVFGLGTGMMAALKRMPGIRAAGINVGQQPSDRVWPDKRKSKEKFLNLKAEIWWLMRDALQNTFEHVTWLESNGARGKQHPPDELLSLPDDGKIDSPAAVLASQLSVVRWHRTPVGKIQIETKEELQKRGVKSPDHADALALTFAPTATEIRVRTVRGLY
jgi:phage terminase large subunit